MSNPISNEARFQRKIERTIELAEKIYIHNAHESPDACLDRASEFLDTVREYAIDKRCEFNGILRDTEESA